MSDHEHPPSRSAGIAFGRIASTVAVRDLPRALAFYVGVVGMEVTFENGDPVGFVILKRDAAELHLTVVKDHRGSTHNVAHLMVADATGLYGHLVAHGTRIVKGLRDADYGLRGFVFADPDGNRIDVGQQMQTAELQIQDETRGAGAGDADHHAVAGPAFLFGKHGVPVVGQAVEHGGLAGAAGAPGARRQDAVRGKAVPAPAVAWSDPTGSQLLVIQPRDGSNRLGVLTGGSIVLTGSDLLPSQPAAYAELQGAMEDLAAVPPPTTW